MQGVCVEDPPCIPDTHAHTAFTRQLPRGLSDTPEINGGTHPELQVDRYQDGAPNIHLRVPGAASPPGSSRPYAQVEGQLGLIYLTKVH